MILAPHIPSLSLSQLINLPPDNQVVFCTGGAGTICSAQVRALVHLGANACIVGRNVEKTETMARDIATARAGAKVLGIGGVDVRKVESLEAAVKRCVDELGGVDFVMLVPISPWTSTFLHCFSHSPRSPPSHLEPCQQAGLRANGPTAPVQPATSSRPSRTSPPTP